MTQLTREEWGEVAERLGEAASDCERIIAEHSEEHEPHPAWHQLVDDLRKAAGAVLWVSENASDRVRFTMLDSHPTD